MGTRISSLSSHSSAIQNIEFKLPPSITRQAGEQHCIMVALRIWEFGDQLYGRLLTGNDPLRSVECGEGDKAAEAAAFQLCRLLQ